MILEKMHLQQEYHAYLLQRKYPQAEIAFSCPRLRPIINNDRINPMDVHEAQLLQVVCAYRLLYTVCFHYGFYS